MNMKCLHEHIQKSVMSYIEIYDREKYLRYQDSQLLLGQMLRAGWLPSILEKWAGLNTSFFYEIRKEDPYLWERLPHILSFGYNTGKVLYSLVDKQNEKTQYTCHISSLFNLIVSLYDYILDEYQGQESILDIVSSNIIQEALTGDTEQALKSIQTKILHSKDVLFKLLLSSIYAWLMYIKFVYSVYKCRDERLFAFIMELFKIENDTIKYTHHSVFDNDLFINNLQKKSAGPFVAIGKFVLEITPELTKNEKRAFEKLINSFGDIFWIVDDLSDIEKDYISCSPNSIIVKASQINYNKPCSDATIPLKIAANRSIVKLSKLYKKIQRDSNFLNKKNDQLLEYLEMNIANWLNLFH